MTRGEKREEEAFENRVLCFRWVQISAGANAAGEGQGGHVSSIENVAFFDLGGVEEDRKTDGVEKYDDSGIGGDEGARRHVGAEDGGAIFGHSGTEKFIFALEVEIVITVFDRTEEGEAIAPRNGFERKFRGRRRRSHFSLLNVSSYKVKTKGFIYLFTLVWGLDSLFKTCIICTM